MKISKDQIDELKFLYAEEKISYDSENSEVLDCMSGVSCDNELLDNQALL